MADRKKGDADAQPLIQFTGCWATTVLLMGMQSSVAYPFSGEGGGLWWSPILGHRRTGQRITMALPSGPSGCQRFSYQVRRDGGSAFRLAYARRYAIAVHSVARGNGEAGKAIDSLVLAATRSRSTRWRALLLTAGASTQSAWSALLLTARPASLTASLIVGWAWIVRARSSALPPYSMCVTTSLMSSPAL